MTLAELAAAAATVGPRFTRLLAEAILADLGPDPDAIEHLLTLQEALGMRCRITGCPGAARARGLCSMHYSAHRRHARNESHMINRLHQPGRIAS